MNDRPADPDPRFDLVPPILWDCTGGLVTQGDALRYDLRAPWSEAGFVYATDGCILARTPEAGVGEAFRPSVPVPANLVDLFADLTGFSPDETSIVDLDLEGDPERCVAVGSVKLKCRYARLLWRHAASVFLPAADRGPSSPVYFTAGRVEGLLMPMV